ncbi:MAG TPA: acetate kinase [Gammaproteobacteria bacterium]|nr:acetate kinase [Gammaproteobacteria bacterium]
MLNAGTATLKAAVMQVDDGRIAEERREQYDWMQASEDQAVAAVLAGIDAPIDAVAHRVVHGGSSFTKPERLDSAVLEEIERLIPLAPLHNARALELIRAANAAFPDVPAFALFDTTFHAQRPPESAQYALSVELADRFELRRYGFHGLAHASLVDALAESTGQETADITAVTLQLGSGCSACAVSNGRSIETSMGYTPLEGLAMPRRSGDIDPAIVLRLIRAGLAPDAIERELTERSGLLGMAGSADVRELLRAEARGDERARLALAIFVRRIVMTAGAYLTLLDGRGMLAFGGGIGTHSPEIRRRISTGLATWNVELDEARNEANVPGPISKAGSRDVYVLRTDEESIMALAIARVLRDGATAAAPECGS